MDRGGGGGGLGEVDGSTSPRYARVSDKMLAANAKLGRATECAARPVYGNRGRRVRTRIQRRTRRCAGRRVEKYHAHRSCSVTDDPGWRGRWRVVGKHGR